MSSKRRRQSGKSFWREWGIYLLVGGVILIGIVIFQLLRPQQIELGPSSHFRLYFTQGNQAETTANLETEIVADIAAAGEFIDLATPGLDVDAIATALVEAQGRGITVRVLESAAAQETPEVAAVTKRLQQAGIPVVLHESEGTLAGAFIVIDRSLVWAGSWDISQRGLHEDSHAVLRFALAQEAENFHTEFMEMFEQGAFGPDSPQNTPHPFLSIYESSLISVYFTPEDEAYEEILRTVAAAQYAVIMATEGLDDSRLEDRFAADAGILTKQFMGVVESQGGTTEETLQLLHENGMILRLYSGLGRLRENAIIVDAQILILFSQPIIQQHLDSNDGYIIIIRDPETARLFQNEALRLNDLAQGWP